jgi:lipopolysaccharide transport system permease protein
MFVVLAIVFSFLFPDPNYKLNLIIGLFLWDFFAEGTKVGLASLHSKGFLLTKTRCPSWILVVTSISNALLTLVAFALVISTYLIVEGRSIGVAGLALFIGYCAALTAMVIGISLASSVLFLRYRDLNQVWDVVTQAGFFVAPVVYPLRIIPERFHFYLYFWPPTPVIEFSRAALLGHAYPSSTAHAYLAIDAVVILSAGIAIFRFLAPRAAEYV